MNRRRTALALVALLALPVAACGKAQSGEETAWAGALCTATANVYLASTLLANDVPPPEKLTADNLPLYQARLGTEISEVSTAIESVDRQLGSVPSGLTSTVSSLTGPSEELSAAFTASGGPLSAVTGAADVDAAQAAMPPADKATRTTQLAAVSFAQAVIALNSNPAFSSASTCQIATPTPVAS